MDFPRDVHVARKLPPFGRSVWRAGAVLLSTRPLRVSLWQCWESFVRFPVPPSSSFVIDRVRSGRRVVGGVFVWKPEDVRHVLVLWSAGKWYAYVDCVGRRDTPTTLFEMRADEVLALPSGTLDPKSPSPLKCRACIALEFARFREFPVRSYKNRCDPMATCEDICTACPRVVDIRRAASGDTGSASLRVLRHRPPANASGSEDVRGRGSEVPSEGTSLLLLAARACGTGPRAGQVAVEPIGRIRLNRAPYMKFRLLFGPGIQGRDRALEFFRHVAKGTNDVVARTRAKERENICDAVRILFPPYAPDVEAAAPRNVLPEGMSAALGVPYRKGCGPRGRQFPPRL